MKLRRSVLITPGNDLEMLNKAAKSEADVVWLELEDGVHPSRKVAARDIAIRALTEIDWRGKERIVRVNPMYSETGPGDVRAIAPARPDAFLLTKIQDPSEVEEADRIISEVEGDTETGIKIWCMIETAKGLVNVERIATASKRVDALFFGGGDMSADLKVKRIGLGRVRALPYLEGLKVELLYGRSRTIAAARAAGIGVIDVSHSDIRDLDGAYIDALYSFQLGFDGKMVITPRQIEGVHRAYAPSPEDIDWAQRVLSTFEEIGRDGKTVAVVDNEMIDGPFIRSAELIMERLQAIREIDGGAKRARV